MLSFKSIPVPFNTFLIEQLKEIPGVHGIHIMAVGWEDIVAEMVERAGLMPRPIL